MKKELKQWAWDMKRTIDNVIERINDDILSDKDAVETANMLLQLDHEVRNDPEYHTDTAIPAISVTLNELYDALNDKNVKLLQLDNDIFRQLLSFGEILITKEERESWPVGREDGRTYIDFLPRMPYAQYQQLVENLKELGAKYDLEMKQWYVDKDWEPKQAEQHKTSEPYIFKAVYYDDSERKELFGDTKESLLNKVLESFQSRDGVELTGKERCYIQEYDTKERKYQQEGIYLIASGRDVTPVKIQLPYMSQETFKKVKEELKKMGAKFDVDKKMWYIERGDEFKMDAIQNYLNGHDEAIYLKLPHNATPEQFKEMISQLKQDGARYNPDKKAWYITSRNDINKFTQYLPSGSIHTKLEQNKRAAENDPGRGRSMEPRKKDAHVV